MVTFSLHHNRKSSSSTASTSTNVSTAATSVATLPPPVTPSPPPQQEPSDPGVGPDVNVDPNAENPDWTYDPNEPRYCICNQVSYGDMVACDNEDVSISLSVGVSQGTIILQTGLSEIMNCTSAQRSGKIGVIVPEIHTVHAVVLPLACAMQLKVLVAGDSFMS